MVAAEILRPNPYQHAALALRPSRACRLMPLTFTPPGSLEALMTCPPGHMQKVYTPRPSGVGAFSLYSAGGKRRMPR